MKSWIKLVFRHLITFNRKTKQKIKISTKKAPWEGRALVSSPRRRRQRAVAGLDVSAAKVGVRYKGAVEAGESISPTRLLALTSCR